MMPVFNRNEVFPGDSETSAIFGSLTGQRHRWEPLTAGLRACGLRSAFA